LEFFRCKAEKLYTFRDLGIRKALLTLRGLQG